MKIILIAATDNEISPFCSHFKIRPDEGFKPAEGHEIMVKITGPGIPNTLVSMLSDNSLYSADLLINAGICGSFDFNIPLGTVVEISKDRFGDLGAETAEGEFIDIFDMNLQEKNAIPFKEGWLYPTFMKDTTNLPRKSGITVQKVHGYAPSISRITEKYQPDTESMEGAAFLLAAYQLGKPSIQIRSLSNYVEPRNRANWQIEHAISALNDFLIRDLWKIC